MNHTEVFKQHHIHYNATTETLVNVNIFLWSPGIHINEVSLYGDTVCHVMYSCTLLSSPHIITPVQLHHFPTPTHSLFAIDHTHF